MNIIAAVEVIGAVLATGWDFLNRLLGTTQLTTQQFGLALLSAIALLAAWEIAKAIARQQVRRPSAPTPRPVRAP
jgi:Ca2+-transporting ATPase